MTSSSTNNNTNNGTTGTGSGMYDAVVVGGSAAGLSGAVALARSMRSVLVVDAGEPRNAPAHAVHNFYTRDGASPQELVAAGRAEAAAYGVEFLDGDATTAARISDGFEVTLADGTIARGRRLLVATGLVDELPEVPGVREGWGADVLHCPFCHGWEVRGRAIGILGSSARSVHQALMFRQLSPNVTLFVHTAPDPTEDEYDLLAARGISVVLGTVARLRRDGGTLTAVELEGASVHPVEALVVGPRFVARSGVLAGLGLEPVEHPMGVGRHLETGMNGATSVPGVWAAGNVTDLMAQVVTSAGAGLMAGAAIHADLMLADNAAALEAYRGRANVDPTQGDAAGALAAATITAEVRA